MNTKIQDRQAANVRSWADCFPYVNGGSFPAAWKCLVSAKSPALTQQVLRSIDNMLRQRCGMIFRDARLIIWLPSPLYSGERGWG